MRPSFDQFLRATVPYPCHPERTQDSCHATHDRTACAAFCKESRMEFVNAIKLDRNPGVAEGSAVRLSPKPRPYE